MKNITSSENALIILQGLHVIPGDLMITLVQGPLCLLYLLSVEPGRLRE